MSAPAHPARMEPSALTVPMDTSAGALKVSLDVSVCLCMYSVLDKVVRADFKFKVKTIITD